MIGARPAFVIVSAASGVIASACIALLQIPCPQLTTLEYGTSIATSLLTRYAQLGSSDIVLLNELCSFPTAWHLLLLYSWTLLTLALIVLHCASLAAYGYARHFRQLSACADSTKLSQVWFRVLVLTSINFCGCFMWMFGMMNTDEISVFIVLTIAW